jgi:hypothetical protein
MQLEVEQSLHLAIEGYHWGVLSIGESDVEDNISDE